MRRVAVTGLGAVTPVGNDVESTWQSLVAGRSGVGRITTFEPDTYKVRIAGLVKGFELDPYLDDEHKHMAEHLGRAGGFGIAAATQALRDARVDEAPYEPHERGLSMGASVGRPELKDLADMLHPIEHGLDLYRQPPEVFLPRDPNLAMEMIAELGKCEGPMISVSTACTASAHSVGEAYRRIQDGEVKLMISGGFDALTSWLDVLGFALLGALTAEYNDEPERGSRPFSADRSGFVLGEGAVVAILEDLEEAEKPVSAPTRSTTWPLTARVPRGTTSARRPRSRKSSGTMPTSSQSAQPSR
jgi:3-oxoacyl-[acyl-carrier-protein] synthase II